MIMKVVVTSSHLQQKNSVILVPENNSLNMEKLPVY